MTSSYLSQNGYDVRCEWGEQGVAALAPVCNAIVIVDVLSFSTCVTIAVERGSRIVPWDMDIESAAAYAASVDAIVAGSRSTTELSLSPQSWLHGDPPERAVLRSPNGAALSRMTGETTTVLGCIRNAGAVADYVNSLTGPVAIVPAGERWLDGSLRPALEDWLGAGAIISRVRGRRSPEADAACRMFELSIERLCEDVRATVSGQELVEMGFGQDINLACVHNATRAIPVLRDGEFIDLNNPQSQETL